MSVLAMVVLLERETENDQVVASRGWVVPPEVLALLEGKLRSLYGDPVQSGLRDLESGTDVYLSGDGY